MDIHLPAPTNYRLAVVHHQLQVLYDIDAAQAVGQGKRQRLVTKASKPQLRHPSTKPRATTRQNVAQAVWKCHTDRTPSLRPVKKKMREKALYKSLIMGALGGE